MAGKKGQPHQVRVRTDRQQMWQTMRIKAGRGFTIPDLLVTVPGATLSNVQKFVIRLERHGIIKKTGPSGSGRPGVYQAYRLAHNTGPLPPDICPICGRMMAAECGGEKE
jgi:hypothetical protein